MNRPLNPNQPQESPSKVKTFKRRRCENCNALYQPTREDQRFCRKDGDNCRKEFHRYGSSYGPLKTGLHKAIDKKYAELEKAVGNKVRGLVADIVQKVGQHIEDTYRSEQERQRVELAKALAQIDVLRGQIQDHTHDVNEFTEAGETVLRTSIPDLPKSKQQ